MLLQENCFWNRSYQQKVSERRASCEIVDKVTAAAFFRQFQAGMLFRDSALLDRIFRVFDVDDDNQISFYEYLSCLSTISTKAAKEDKLRCELLQPYCNRFHLSLFSLFSS